MSINEYQIDEQKQSLSANQVQALKILAFTNQELEDFMVNEYLENPMLESMEQKENELMTSIEKFSDSETETVYEAQHPGSPDEDEPYRRELSDQNGNQVKENLLGQLNWKDYSKRQWKMMGYLVDCLDEKGFFTHDLEELSETSGYEKEELSRCLAILRELEPVGIFSPNLAECLIKQLENRDIKDETLFLLLREYLPHLVGGQLGVISRGLGISTIQVKEYIHLIGSLNPRPIMDIQRLASSYVVPDILVSRQGERWIVELNDEWMEGYRYSDYYIHMMKQSTDPELTAYFNERLERAKLVLDCVEQRRKTIIHIVEAIVKEQEAFFERKGPLAPMTIEDIAKALGIHPSIVNQAIEGKYMQYKKAIPLSTLFSAQ